MVPSVPRFVLNTDNVFRMLYSQYDPYAKCMLVLNRLVNQGCQWRTRTYTCLSTTTCLHCIHDQLCITGWRATVVEFESDDCDDMARNDSTFVACLQRHQPSCTVTMRHLTQAKRRPAWRLLQWRPKNCENWKEYKLAARQCTYRQGEESAQNSSK